MLPIHLKQFENKSIYFIIYYKMKSYIIRIVSIYLINFLNNNECFKVLEFNNDYFLIVTKE